MDVLLVAILSIPEVELFPLYLWKCRHDSQSHPHDDEPHQALQREIIVRTTSTRRMCRRPTASSGSTSSAPPPMREEGNCGRGFAYKEMKPECIK